MTTNIDLGGNTLIVEDLKVNATGPGQAGTSLNISDLTSVTPGTAAASKAVVLDSSKGIATITSATITTLTSTAVNAATLAATTSATVTSASANALAVGLAGATNPAFKVDSSTASQAAGLRVTGAATGGTVAVDLVDSGSNTNLTLNGKGTGTIGIGSVSTGAVTITPALGVASTITGTSASASALAIGRLGATTPAFTVDASTGSQVAGLKVVGAATGGNVAVVVTDSGSNANLLIDAKGTGTITVAGTSTGAVTITPATTITGLLTATGGLTSVAGSQLYSGTAIPAGGTTGSGLKLSSTSNLGLFFGSGAPTLSAAQGSLYIRTDGSSTSTRLYVNSNGSTTWVNFTSAS